MALSRREFLKSTGALSLTIACPAGAVAKPGSGGAAVLSADMVLSVAASGAVTFDCPYSEMGQGATTAASMILADELGTDLDRLVFQHSNGIGAFVSDTYRERFNGGGSGGSQSIATAWPALRKIGATAREMLVSAAAQVWRVPEAECHAAVDRVEHRPSRRTLEYGSLVEIAADLPVPEEPEFRPASEYRYIGRDRPLRDCADIVRGEALYAMDISVPGMLYAGVERSPCVKGKVAGFNREAVVAVDGVVDVFAIDTRDTEAACKNGVAVVARDTWSVLQGRKALDVEWEDEPDLRSGDEQFHADLFKRLESGSPNDVQNVGDIDSVNSDGLERHESRYVTPHQNQTPMEPIAIVAWDHGDRMEIRLGTQLTPDVRDHVAKITGLEPEAVDVHNTIMGGSFGRKSVPDGLTESVLIARKVKKPVKLVWTREDDIQHGQYRNACASEITALTDSAGVIRSWRHCAVRTSPEDPSLIKNMLYGMTDWPYQFDNARFEIFGLQGEVNLGPMRSPPHPLYYFAVTSFLDELAHRYGRDPIDYHVELIGSSHEVPLADWLVNHGHEDRSDSHVAVAKAVRKLSGWDKPIEKGRGRGFSSGFIFGTHLAMVAEVTDVGGAIRIDRMYCSVDCGRVINPDGAEKQIVGGIIYGLSSAMGEAITTADGAVQQSNYHDYPLMRASQAPEVIVEFLPSDGHPSGLGEPGTPPAYAALANAVFAATGQRIREIPLSRHIRFVS